MNILKLPNPRDHLKKTIRGRNIYADVMERDNHTCQACGLSFSDGARMRIDHILPRSKGGTHHPDNLHVLCDHCNCVKAGWLDRRLSEIQAALQATEIREHASVIRSVLAVLSTAGIVAPSSIERWAIACSCGLVRGSNAE